MSVRREICGFTNTGRRIAALLLSDAQESSSEDLGRLLSSKTMLHRAMELVACSAAYEDDQGADDDAVELIVNFYRATYILKQRPLYIEHCLKAVCGVGEFCGMSFWKVTQQDNEVCVF